MTSHRRYLRRSAPQPRSRSACRCRRPTSALAETPRGHQGRLSGSAPRRQDRRHPRRLRPARRPGPQGWRHPRSTTRARAARRSTTAHHDHVNRPERTIVRDVDNALPTFLAGLALLVALGGAGFALIRTRSLQRGVVGRSH